MFSVPAIYVLGPLYVGKLTEDGHQEIHVLETMLGLPGAPIMTGPRHWPGCSAISPMSAIGVPMLPWKSEQPIEPRSMDEA